MKKQLMTITPQGDVVCVYHDENRKLYRAIGKGKNVRASDVVSKPGIDGHEVFEACIRIDGTTLPVNESRNEVIKQEVDYLERNILTNIKQNTILEITKG